MRYSLTLVLFVSLFLSELAAQSADERPPSNWVVLTGLGYEWFYTEHRVQYLAVEKVVGSFWHLGLQGSRIEFFRKQQTHYSSLHSNWEISFYGKYFLHGRLSGQKSALYFGPELVFGQTIYKVPETLSFPPQPSVAYLLVPVNVRKYMVRWGLQWRLRRSVVEFSSPVGIKTARSTDLAYLNENLRSFIMQPTIWLGLAF